MQRLDAIVRSSEDLLCCGCDVVVAEAVIHGGEWMRTGVFSCRYYVSKELDDFNSTRRALYHLYNDVL